MIGADGDPRLAGAGEVACVEVVGAAATGADETVIAATAARLGEGEGEIEADIANLTGTSRQTVTSVLNDLKKHNLIYFSRNSILIRDVKKLA